LTRGREWSRRYPPLLALIAAVVLAITALPSALNLPTANPGEVAEYAPVPGHADAAPPNGNLAALGLGQGGVSEGGGGAAIGPGGQGLSPSDKHCVGTPPRQTEDPMSPPCVGYFAGNNGGATYPGVSAGEVRVVLYITNDQYHNGSQGEKPQPLGQCFNLATAPSSGEPYFVTAGRIWQYYFNDRFETYGRKVHFWVCFASASSAQAAAQDAAQNYAAIHPFANFVDDFSGFGIDYIRAMAQHGVLNFGSSLAEPASVYRQYPGLIWSFDPSIEQHADQFASYVCTKVVPYKVSFSGNAADMNQPRRLGLLRSGDPSKPAFSEFASLVEAKIRACGGDVVATATYPQEGYLVDANGGDTQAAANNMPAFQRARVTTVIWEEGMDDVTDMPAAARISWFPEWVLAGDSQIDDIVFAKYQDRNELAHAWVVTNEPLLGPFHTYDCFQAEYETDPQLPPTDASVPCQLYTGLRQLFTGIQVAGPRLTPASIDQGFHAIPGNPSSSPREPACFYAQGDYTCVKDAAVMWYDTSASSDYSATPGCWRAADGGVRYLAGRWPPGDVKSLQRISSDPCNNYDSTRYSDPSPGSGSPPTQ